ncbi:MAG: sigma-70 family RNA polymerase sigma factor [Bacteroidota bacterium]
MNKTHNIFNSQTDLELVLQYKQTGNKQYVGALFERYSTMVVAICMKYYQDREESKDATMHIFEKLMTDLLKHEVSNFKSWVHSVTRNYCLMEIRKTSNIHKIRTDVEENYVSVMENQLSMHQEDKSEKEVLLTGLEKCMELLIIQQKKCVELFFIQEKSYQDITQELGFTLNEVKSFLQNGKRNLKNCLEKNNG